MKKYGMIFASVIFTLLIMFVPNEQVKAEDTVYVHIDYDSEYVTNLLDIASEKLEIAEQLTDYYSSSNRSAIIIKEDFINFILFDSDITLKIFDYFGGGFNSKIEARDSSYKYYQLYYNKTYDISSIISELDKKSSTSSGLWMYMNSGHGIYGESIPSESFKLYEYSSLNNSGFDAAIIYSTNLDYLEYDQTSKSLPITFDGINFLIEGDNFLTYSDYTKTVLKNIDITSGYVCDLEGNDMELVTIDYANVYNENYIYQYKTDFSDWIDVTDSIKEASLYGYYYFQFNTYYNTLVEARVLDIDNNVIVSNSYNVTNLIDYNSGYIFRGNFSSSSHSNLKYITFQSNFNELNVSHNFRLQYLSNDKSLVNIPNFIKYEAYLVDINGVILDYNFNDYFTISYDEYKLYEEDYEKYLDGIVTQIRALPNNVYGFKILFEFDNLTNYTINVFDDYSKTTYWSYMKDFLKGYTRIKFPSNYDTAIIRSKNFTDLSSSLIYLNIMFSSPEYGLNFYNYDFINNRTNYSYDISDLNTDYSMISFDINESNNIFPILFRNSNSEDVFIYLKDDCFIQFINRDTLDSYIVGTDEDNFNNNDDLNINNGFNDFINSNFNFDNATFFEKVSNGFNVFKDVIVEIFQNVNYFFQRLSSDLQYFYVVVFSLIIFIFLTRFLL